MGTAGYSPQQGGVIDTTRGCDAANPSTAITREGDLCITPWAINWDCKLTDWSEQCAGFPNVCRCTLLHPCRPMQTLPLQPLQIQKNLQPMQIIKIYSTITSQDGESYQSFLCYYHTPKCML